MAVTIPPELWQTIKQYMFEVRGIVADDRIRRFLESEAEIKVLDGVCFVAIGSEFDLFVVPKKRGKWNIRKEVAAYLSEMLKRWGTVKVKIYAWNTASLRLATFFGFREVGRSGDLIRLELHHG